VRVIRLGVRLSWWLAQRPDAETTGRRRRDLVVSRWMTCHLMPLLHSVWMLLRPSRGPVTYRSSRTLHRSHESEWDVETRRRSLCAVEAEMRRHLGVHRDEG